MIKCLSTRLLTSTLAPTDKAQFFSDDTQQKFTIKFKT